MRLTTALLLAASMAGVCHANGEAGTMAEFSRHDRDGNGYLSRAEMQACGCEALDSNGDLIVMPAEFLARAGRAAASRPPATAPATRPAPERPGADGTYRPGDRVKAGCYGNMKAAVIQRIQDGRAYVHFADEPNCDGFRDLVALRPADDAGTRRPGGESASGAPPPSGTYNCQKIAGGMLIGLGNLEVRGRKYSGIAGGGFAPFEIDTAGGIIWTKGLDGLPEGWVVQSSRYEGLDYLGRPLIKIAYRHRGASDLMDCVRE